MPAGVLAAVAAELARLTPRDRQLLGLLAEHRTLTTEQIAQATFGTIGRARNRLNTLHTRDVLDRFRHYVRPGSQSWRWTLGPVGAAIVAAAANAPLPRPAAVRTATNRLALSPTLRHLLGVNGFFTELLGHARTHDGATLTRWCSERQATRECANAAHPDAGGVWTEHGRAVTFWLEHDTGTEPLARVAAKLAGYATLSGTRVGHPVLIWLPTAVRESNLSAHLTRTGIPAGVTVATAAGDHADAHGGPPGPVWQVHGHAGRLRLAELGVPAPYRGDDGGAAWDG